MDLFANNLLLITLIITIFPSIFMLHFTLLKSQNRESIISFLQFLKWKYVIYVLYRVHCAHHRELDPYLAQPGMRDLFVCGRLRSSHWLETLTSGFLNSLGFMQRTKNGWHTLSVLISISRERLNWLLRVGERFLVSTP